MDLNELRVKIEEVDREILEAFELRMQIVEEIGRVKLESGKAILDSSREESRIKELTSMADERTRPYVRELYMTLFEISRDMQTKIVSSDARED